MLENVPYNLDELYEGMALEVLTMDNQLTFVGRLEDIENKTLQIVEPLGGELPPVLYNQPIKLRGFLRGMRAIVMEGMVCGSTPHMWQVDRLVTYQVQETREFFRQRVKIDAKLMLANRIYAPEREHAANEGKSVPCTLLDVSAGGALIKCREQYRKGDWMFLMDARIGTEERPFSFTCQVRRVQEGLGYALYGCHFEGVDDKEQDRLLRAIFSIQRSELQAQRARGG